jgi:hypothetical protein
VKEEHGGATPSKRFGAQVRAPPARPSLRLSARGTRACGATLLPQFRHRAIAAQYLQTNLPANQSRNVKDRT